MRVLVTGGAGFIGSHVVDALVDGGHDVVVLDSLVAHRGIPGYVHPDAAYEQGDVRDPAAWIRAIGGGVDAVSHQAARVGLGVDFRDVTAYVSDNDVGTAVGLQALHERGFAGRFVLASSMVVYGEGRYDCPAHGRIRPGPRRAEDLAGGRFEPTCPRCDAALDWAAVDEDDGLDPRNVYAATKLHQEHLVAAYAREHGSQAVALRYHNVYGPRMPRDTPYAGVASIFRSAYARGAAPRVFEDGGQTRDFVHVRDVARANVLALTADAASGAYNVASGTPHTVLEMANALAGGMPEAAAPVVTGDYRLGDVRHVVASPRRARDELGFSATVGFEEGLAAFATDELRR